MGLTAWWSNRELEFLLPAGAIVWKHLDIYLSLRLLIAIFLALAALIAAARLLRIAEFDEASARLLRRVGATRGRR
jgi:hypothetical protein